MLGLKSYKSQELNDFCQANFNDGEIIRGKPVELSQQQKTFWQLHK